MRNKVRLQFLGATGYVTGSRTLVETHDTRVYVDAGLYQGPRYIEEKNYEPLETDPSTMDAVFLTHAHIDHSGLLPLLVKKGFKGKIYCTPATAELLHILLPDAARIQEEEFRFLSKKKIEEYDLDGPLFNEEDVHNTLKLLQVVPFGQDVRVKSMVLRYHWVGHILGAASLTIKVDDKTILFSGDIGPEESILHRGREKPPLADYVIMESTYGSRAYERENYRSKIIAAVKHIVSKKSMLIIPSFAVGRTQLILYVFFRLIEEKKIPELPIFIDSPMASRATLIYMQFPEELQPHVLKEGYLEFLQSKKIRLIEDVAESKRLNYFNGPGVIISAGGMCSGGRILHHLYNRLWDRRNYVLFVGYQSEGTIGRQIIDGSSRIKIFGREIPVRSKIETINSFSAHADINGLISWAKNFEEAPPKILFLNHGEEESRENLARHLTFLKDTRIELPRYESTYYL
ncbi:MAG: MBL fold metallo-hydrolase [Leptospiraceae bacterium]|nr:MBL fold metallo-hydrolase [Leptospiraceae bacterium]MDW8306272.1 MBL fold metallo-hydrolase [Leptospiraceae bacterium]